MHCNTPIQEVGGDQSQTKEDKIEWSNPFQ